MASPIRPDRGLASKDPAYGSQISLGLGAVGRRLSAPGRHRAGGSRRGSRERNCAARFAGAVSAIQSAEHSRRDRGRPLVRRPQLLLVRRWLERFRLLLVRLRLLPRLWLWRRRRLARLARPSSL